ncbi:MAG TPA: LptA/OstA family protein [Stellaceae bacterium]|nr:LptA/OstA family protein [Stellaceae bacterium]
MRRRSAWLALPVLVTCLLTPALAQAPKPTAKPAAKPAAAAPAKNDDSKSGAAKNDTSTGLSLGKDDNGKPVTIEADQGIEWQQNTHIYIARGNAKATRGAVSVEGDTLTAHYRAAGKSDGATPASDRGEDPSGNTEIYRVDCDGNVRIVTANQVLVGDHAVYDVDKASLVVTGKNLKLTTPRDVVTARDSLEWYDHDQLAVARGDAVAVRDQKKVRADTLTALVERDQSGTQHLTRVDAHGNVVVTSQDQIGRGDAGVYNVESGISTLIGNVRLTRGGNELRGQYAVIDLNHNVSRLLSTPPSTKLTGGPAPGPVQGLIYPHQQGAPVTTPKQ